MWPAGPGDKVDDNVILEAVDGKKFDCYGKKEIEIKDKEIKMVSKEIMNLEKRMDYKISIIKQEIIWIK